MTSRLVVGSGPTAKSLCRSVGPTDPRTVLVSEEKSIVEWAIERTDCETRHADPTVPSTYVEFSEGVRSAIVTEPAAVPAIETALPETYVLTVGGTDGVASVDPTTAVCDAVLAATDARPRQLARLRPILTAADELAIVAHDNPDPDSIASGMALAAVADRLDCAARLYYFGSISHQQNRAFVNLLEIDLEAIDDQAAIDDADAVALVDHTRPGVNDRLDPETPIDVVIDHHPPRAPVDARYVDLDSSVGATSSMMVEYLDHYDVDIDRRLATALLFGQRVDTDQFRREVSVADFDAAARLVAAADLSVLQRIENPGVSPSALETIGRAITNRRRHGSILTSFVGRPDDRDTLAQAADQLLAIRDVTTTLVYGLTDGTVYLSARARGTDLDVGTVLREAFDRIGSAGGHADMAGGQLEVGLLVDRDEADDIERIVDRVIAERFLEAIERQPSSEPVLGDREAIPHDSLIDPPTEWGRSPDT
ncbi:MAG: DHH family phosphoesterase [Halococcoides sp.]